MMKMNIEKIAARYLTAGTVLAGSGFTVTHAAYRGVRTPKGKVVVEGFYPDQPVKAHLFNASSVFSVRSN